MPAYSFLNARLQGRGFKPADQARYNERLVRG
jgi:hypothetical protein